MSAAPASAPPWDPMGHETRIQRLEDGFSDLREGVGGLRADVRGLKDQVDEVNDKLDKLTASLETHNKNSAEGMAKLGERVGSLEADIKAAKGVGSWLGKKALPVALAVLLGATVASGEKITELLKTLAAIFGG